MSPADMEIWGLTRARLQNPQVWEKVRNGKQYLETRNGKQERWPLRYGRGERQTSLLFAIAGNTNAVYDCIYWSLMWHNSLPPLCVFAELIGQSEPWSWRRIVELDINVVLFHSNPVNGCRRGWDWPAWTPMWQMVVVFDIALCLFAGAVGVGRSGTLLGGGLIYWA